MTMGYRGSGSLSSTLSAVGFVFAVATSNVFAQAILTPQVGNSPEGVQEPSEQRPAQQRLANAQSVRVTMNERGGRSTSALESIPESIADIVIQSERDIAEKVFPLILPLYGLSGTETLQLNASFPLMGDTHYEYREYIQDIRTPYTIRVVVNGRTQTITHVLGLLAIDRGYDPNPEMAEDEAIEIAIRHIRATEGTSRQQILRTDDPRAIRTEARFIAVEGDGLVAIWSVLVPLDHEDAKASAQPVFETYMVNPDQTVRGGVGFGPMTIRVCGEVTSSTPPYCDTGSTDLAA